MNTNNISNRFSSILTYLNDFQFNQCNLYTCVDVGDILSRYSRFKFNYKHYNLFRKILFYISSLETIRLILLTWLTYYKDSCQQTNWFLALIIRDSLSSKCDIKRTLYPLTLQAAALIWVMRFLFYKVSYSCAFAIFLIDKPRVKCCESRAQSVCLSKKFTNLTTSIAINESHGLKDNLRSDERLEERHLLLSPNVLKSHPLRGRYQLNENLLKRCYKESNYNLTNAIFKKPLHYTERYRHRMVIYHSLAFFVMTVLALIHIAFAFFIYLLGTFDFGDSINRYDIITISNNSEVLQFNLTYTSNKTLTNWLEIVGFGESVLVLFDFYLTFAYSFVGLIFIYIDLYIWQRKLHERLDEILFIRHWRCFLQDTQNRLCLSKKDVDKVTLHIINDLHSFLQYNVDTDNIASVCNLLSILLIAINLVYIFWPQIGVGDALPFVMLVQIVNSTYFALTMCLIVANINSRVSN